MYFFQKHVPLINLPDYFEVSMTWNISGHPKIQTCISISDSIVNPIFARLIVLTGCDKDEIHK
jgi:hypothetical protein